jgi:hypothetical protein
MTVDIGKLTFVRLADAAELVGEPVRQATIVDRTRTALRAAGAPV